MSFSRAVDGLKSRHNRNTALWQLPNTAAKCARLLRTPSPAVCVSVRAREVKCIRIRVCKRDARGESLWPRNVLLHFARGSSIFRSFLLAPPPFGAVTYTRCKDASSSSLTERICIFPAHATLLVFYFGIFFPEDIGYAAFGG